MASCAPCRRPRGCRQLLAKLGRTLTAVVVFEIDDDELVRRISGRTVCESCQTPYTDREPGTRLSKCGGKLVRRADDEPEAVRNRLVVYQAQTAPVITWYLSTACRWCRSMRWGRRPTCETACCCAHCSPRLTAMIRLAMALLSVRRPGHGADMIQLKSSREIELMAHGGRILGETLGCSRPALSRVSRRASSIDWPTISSGATRARCRLSRDSMGFPGASASRSTRRSCTGSRRRSASCARAISCRSTSA